MEIDQAQEPDYESVKIDYVGFVDPYAVEGMLVLKGDDGKEFHMRAFSGEVARHISSFVESTGESVPSIYKMMEEICEENELVLVKVKIYDKHVLHQCIAFEDYFKFAIFRNPWDKMLSTYNYFIEYDSTSASLLLTTIRPLTITISLALPREFIPDWLLIKYSKFPLPSPNSTIPVPASNLVVSTSIEY